VKVIAGNCVLEDLDISVKTIEFLLSRATKLGFDLVYKSSFKKDNRSDVSYYTGPDNPIEQFRELRNFGVPLLTDFHNLYELDSELVDLVDIVQLPAFLCMQTELTLKLASIGKAVNIKKGQFLHPEDMLKVIKKVESTNNYNVSVTERGTCFGYRDLIVDPRSFYILKSFGYPVYFDVGHSVRKYGIPSNLTKGGTKEFICTLAKCAVACGVDGIFVEVHPNPNEAKCDAATQLDFYQFDELINEVLPLWRFLYET